MALAYSVFNTQNIIPTTNAGGNIQSKEERAAENAEQQKIDFLNLLLTQLQNQNPLDPMDTDEYTAQLTRYSILEQNIETNSKLAITNEILKESNLTNNFSYIGQEVEIQTNVNAVQNGKATWRYLVEGDAKEVFLTITDDKGNRIDEVRGSIAKGVQSFTVNATDYNLDEGQILTLNVNARDKDDMSVPRKVTSSITVDGIWSDGQDSYLTAGQMSFRSSDISKVVQYAPPSQPSTQP